MTKQRISNYDENINNSDFNSMFDRHQPTARVVRGNAEGYIQQVVSRSNEDDRYSSIDEYLERNPQGVVEYGQTNGCHHKTFRETVDLVLVKNR